MSKFPLQSSHLTIEAQRERIKFRFGGTFAALRHPNYRWWFFGQLISLVGTWMQSTAQGFFVYELTSSPAYLGYVGFAAGLPTWLFTLYGGLVADRMPRRTLLILTQSSMMLLASILAYLTFTGSVRAWHIVLLALLLGTANAFDAPARLAFVMELVPREDLTNAVALNSTMFNAATAVGPAVAGIAYATLGPAWCFTINALSFIAVIFALTQMHLKVLPRTSSRGRAIDDIRQGFHFVRSDLIVRTLILYLAAVSFLGMGFVTLMPAWAVKVLGGGATTNGWLQSARGIGALLGALLTASLARRDLRGKLITIGTFAFPLALFGFALIRWLPLSLAALVVIGLSLMIYMNNSNSMVQTQTPDELRGRVLSIYSLAFFGLMPLGSLFAGELAARVGEPQTVMIAALLLGICSGVVWFKAPQVRRLG
ncbi:MAG: MFS transporter [Anaerolineales bacterium]|nr:MFS transporter [Anaerolineales bacterium]